MRTGPISPTAVRRAFCKYATRMRLLDTLTFSTTLKLYRPTLPPTIDGLNLHEFISALTTAGLLHPAEKPLHAWIKFGASIAADTRLPPTRGALGLDGHVAWDLCQFRKSPDQMARGLRALGRRPIYRAYLELGSPGEELRQHLRASKRILDGEEFTLDTWTLEVGPVETLRLTSDDHYLSGWLALGLTGPGHVPPWQSRSLVASASAHPDLQRLMRLCRSHWPVPVSPFPAALDLSPLPHDWTWGLSEYLLPTRAA